MYIIDLQSAHIPREEEKEWKGVKNENSLERKREFLIVSKTVTVISSKFPL